MKPSPLRWCFFITITLALFACSSPSSAPSTTQTGPAFPNITQTPSAVSNAAESPSPTVKPSATKTRTLKPTFTTTARPVAGNQAVPFTGEFQLPAPLYYLFPPEWDNPESQVWRLEQDGKTHTQITFENIRVRAFDVSTTGQLAYISENDLIIADADGSNRKVLLAGGPYPDNSTGENQADSLTKTIENPVWSPDGNFLAISLNGVKVIDIRTGKQIQVTPENTDQTGVTWYQPTAWTPDGKHIIISVGLYEGSNLAIARPVAASRIEKPIEPVIGTFGSFTFLQNGRLLFGNASSYLQPPKATALYLLDPLALSNGAEAVEEMLVTPLDDEKDSFISMPKQASDGRIFFFVSPYSTHPDSSAQLAWIDPSLNSENRAIHMVGSFHIGIDRLVNLLWAPDGSLAVLPIYKKNFSIIRTSDGAVFSLDRISGFNLRWGVPGTLHWMRWMRYEKALRTSLP